MAIVDLVHELDIADDLTIDSIDRYSCQEFSDLLHIDPYIGKITCEEAQRIIREKYFYKI